MNSLQGIALELRRYISRLLNGEITITELDVTTIDVATLEINGVAVTRTAAEINALGEFDKIQTATPVNAVAATGVLTIAGVVLDGETVTIGADIYEFAADVAQTVAAGNIAVDIQPHAVKAEGTLTVDVNPVAGDTFTIGTKLFTLVPLGTANADGEVDVEAALADTQANIVAAVNGLDGFNVASTFVTIGAFALDAALLTALVGGTAGNAIDTTETFFAVSNIFDGLTLGTTTPGTDCTNVNGGTELVAEITASGTEPVTAAGTDVVTLTASVMGILANAIDTLDTMATGAFADATLVGGINGTVGEQWQVRLDALFLYVAVDDNTVADRNWRRIDIGAAY